MSARTLPSLEKLIRMQIRRRISAALALLIATVAIVTIIEGLVSVSHRIEKLKSRATDLQYRVISELMVHNTEAVAAILMDENQQHPNEQVEWIPAGGNSSLAVAHTLWQWNGNWTLETPLRGLDQVNFGKFIFRGNLYADDGLVTNLSSRIVLSMVFCLILMMLLLPVSRETPKHLILEPMQKLLSLVHSGGMTSNELHSPRYQEAQDLEIQLLQLLKDRAAKQSEQIESEQARAIAQAVQMLAHDIRRPLILLREVVDGMNDATDIYDARLFADQSLPRVQQAFKNIDQLLDELLLVGEPREPLTGKVNMAHVIDQALATTIPPGSALDERTTIEIDNDLFVAGHDAHLSRALTNLITNAIEAMGPTDKLAIAGRSINDSVEISVTNTGSYIAPEDCESIFKIFYSKGKKTGSGLGLAICKRVIKDHGGSIAVESTLGRGTSFRILLPKFKEITAESRLEVNNRHSEKRILIADDEGNYRNNLEDLTREESGDQTAQVFHAATARSAIELAKSSVFDTIIMDVNFSNDQIDGIAAVRQIRKFGSKAKIIVHSNDSSIALQEAAIRAGANAFIPKPMNERSVRALLS